MTLIYNACYVRLHRSDYLFFLFMTRVLPYHRSSVISEGRHYLQGSFPCPPGNDTLPSGSKGPSLSFRHDDDKQ